jgi:NADH dehydrogenase FAD-containing subunit
MRLASGFPVVLPHGAGATGVELAGTKAAAAKFIEDFSAEHSSSAAIVPAKK